MKSQFIYNVFENFTQCAAIFVQCIFDHQYVLYFSIKDNLYISIVKFWNIYDKRIISVLIRICTWWNNNDTQNILRLLLKIVKMDTISTDCMEVIKIWCKSAKLGFHKKLKLPL